jgi:2-keto-4-pentenoate hydratase/2-oxohepta-3-ene-1,7-dioic acid hydratase in catechol pathway
MERLPMKIVLFEANGGPKSIGILTGEMEDTVLDVSAEAGSDLRTLIEGGPAALSRVQSAVEAGGLTQYPLAEVKLLAPVVSHVRVFGIGLNYSEHAAESKMQTQKVPTVFMKLASSIAHPGQDIILPAISTQPDYEAEFAVVIGKGGRAIQAADWEDHVFGYTIVNDVSARDVQLATSQWTLGKSFPTFTPVGPCIVTRDQVADPHDLEIRLTIDGEELQHSNTKHLIFRVPALIEYISSILPLEPGDIISTGTPQGVGLGRTPQRWLKPGEDIVIEIERIGTLRNRTRAE